MNLPGDYIEEPSENRLFSIFTTGGDSLPIKRLKLTDKVIDQTDRSLNKVLWARYPFDIYTPSSEYKRMLDNASASLGRAGTSTPSELARAMVLRDIEERCQLYLVAHDTACLIEEAMKIDGRKIAFRAYGLLKFNNVAFPADLSKVPDLSELQIIDQGVDQYEKLGLHVLGIEIGQQLMRLQRLMRLAPLHASPVLFTGAQASHLGLAQEQGELLTRLAKGCLGLGYLDAGFHRCAMQFALLAMNMRYIHHPHLIAAVEAYRNAYQAVHPHPTGALVPLPHLDTALDRLRRKNVAGWAHEYCLTDAHEGCMEPQVQSSR